MKAASVTGGPGRSRLFVTETGRPRCGPNDVLVEVHASSVNPKDWKLNQNFASLVPLPGGKRPCMIGDDLSGIVIETGSAVTDYQPGDAVYGMDMNWRTAACAEVARIDQTRIAPKPASISHLEAAGVPLAAQTALQGLRLGKLTSGSKLLVIGASGGVGTFAVQIGKAMGATVTGVCSGRNADLVSDLGADDVIDYTAENFHQRSDDFDLVFDATSYDSFAACASLLNNDGQFISTAGQTAGYLGQLRETLRPGATRSKLIFVNANTADLTTLAGWIDTGNIRVVIDSEYPLDDIDAAYQRSRSGRARGKIVIAIR